MLGQKSRRSSHAWSRRAFRAWTELYAARRWHDELVASAAALNDFRAIAKLQILRQANAHFGQAFAGATDRDRASRQTGVGVDEGVFDIAWRNAEWLFEIGKSGGIFTAARALRTVSK